jgi:hypothetical protein
LTKSIGLIFLPPLAAAALVANMCAVPAIGAAHCDCASAAEYLISEFKTPSRSHDELEVKGMPGDGHCYKAVIVANVEWGGRLVSMSVSSPSGCARFDKAALKVTSLTKWPRDNGWHQYTRVFYSS